MASRHGPLRGGPDDRQHQAVRRLTWKDHGIRDLLKTPTQETLRWARSGKLTNFVLRSGDDKDLETLCSTGISLAGARWDLSQRIGEWSAAKTEKWLDLMFDHGWEGKGGKPEPILAVSEHHPQLLEKWSKRVPKTWHTRKSWLENTFTLSRGMDPEEVRAWFRVGSNHGGASKLVMEQWFSHSNDEAKCKAVLVAIKESLDEDRHRRRVRGEPPFRDWPWDTTREAAASQGMTDILEWVSSDLPMPTQAALISWVATSRAPISLLEAAKKMNWRVPHHKTEASHRLVNAVLHAHGRPGKTDAISDTGKALIKHLMDEGYGVNLSTEARVVVENPNFPAELTSLIQAAQLRGAQPKAAPLVQAPRRRL